MIRIRTRTAIILHDLFMAEVAWTLAWWVRYNLDFPFPEWDVWLVSSPIVIIVQFLVFWRFNLYRGIWRFASVPDLWNIFRSAFLGALCIALALFISFRLEGVPRSVLVLYPVFLMFFLGGPRLGYRFWKDHSLNIKMNIKGERVFIIGAGRAGEMLVRDMLREGTSMPIGFLDDNSALTNSEIQGVRVLGKVNQLPELVRKYNPDILIIAIPSATNQEMQSIVFQCEKTGLPIRTLPNLADMVSGSPSLKELRSVSIEDLLGRDKVNLDWQTIQTGITDKIVMITGGGGSIGSELCRQIAGLNPRQLIIYERSEFNLYKILQEIERKLPKTAVAGMLGDVCDERMADNIIGKYRPQVIFHTAAYKHVPLLQEQCREGVRNNVFGTVNMANAAVKYNCEKFVFISTDKAVNPANVLGASKRLAEMYCDSKNDSGNTRFITVRFGNVLGSDGSVVPLFQKQIEDGGPVTVTHPEVTRFFMTISEACQLILQACAMGSDGEIFVLDMGEPVKILYLAEQMIRLSGREPNKDISIEITGLRPGEKLYEELFYDNEVRDETSHPKIFLARHPALDKSLLEKRLAELKNICNEMDEDKVRELMGKIIPISGILDNKSEDNVIPLSKN